MPGQSKHRKDGKKHALHSSVDWFLERREEDGRESTGAVAPSEDRPRGTAGQSGPDVEGELRRVMAELERERTRNRGAAADEAGFAAKHKERAEAVRRARVQAAEREQELRARIDELEEALEVARHSVRRSEDTNARVSDTQSVLRRRVSELEEAGVAAQAKIGELREALEQGAKRHREQLLRLTRKLDKQVGAHNEIERQASSREKELRATVGELERKLRESESTAAGIQAKLSEAQLRYAESGKALQAVRRRQAALMEERDALLKEKEARPEGEAHRQAVRLSGALIRKARAHDTLKREASERERRLEARIRELEDAAAASSPREALDDALSELDVLRDENRFLTKRLRALDKVLMEARAHLEAAGDTDS
jgi:hypothetical protein